eukprot:3135855-Pleurochrysis_carterae.AAC.2
MRTSVRASTPASMQTTDTATNSTAVSLAERRSVLLPPRRDLPRRVRAVAVRLAEALRARQLATLHVPRVIAAEQGPRGAVLSMQRGYKPRSSTTCVVRAVGKAAAGDEANEGLELAGQRARTTAHASEKDVERKMGRACVANKDRVG